MLKRNTLFLVALLSLGQSVMAQFPKFDNFFGTAGKAHLDFPPLTNEFSNALAVDNQGRFVCVGHNRPTDPTLDKFVVARYTKLGVLDKTFNSTGYNYIELIPTGSKDYGFDVVVLPDNSVVGVGYASYSSKASVVVVKFKADGTLDNSFGGNNNGRAIINFGNTDVGKCITYLAAENKFIVGGTTAGTPFLCKLNANGTLDNTWNGSGFSELGSYSESNINVNNIVVDKDGKYILVGDIDEDNPTPQSPIDILWTKFNADGTLDGTYKKIGTTGLTNTLESCYDAVLEADGNILLVGTRNRPGTTGGSSDVLENLLIRVNSNGTVLKEFYRDFGNLVNESFRAGAIQKDGKIVVVGNVDKDNFIIRFNKDLTIDNSFTQTKFRFGFKTELTDVLINDNCQIITTGYSISQGSPATNNFLIARLQTECTIPTFDKDDNIIPLSVFPNPASNQINVAFQLGSDNEVSIEIYDLVGKKLQQIELGFRGVEPQSENFDVSDLENGNYICRLVTKQGASNQRFTILK